MERIAIKDIPEVGSYDDGRLMLDNEITLSELIAEPTQGKYIGVYTNDGRKWVSIKTLEEYILRVVAFNHDKLEELAN